MSSHARDPQQIPNGIIKHQRYHVTGYMGLDVRF